MSSNSKKTCCDPFSTDTHSRYTRKLSTTVMNKLKAIGNDKVVTADDYICDTCRNLCYSKQAKAVTVTSSSDTFSSAGTLHGADEVSV